MNFEVWQWGAIFLVGVATSFLNSLAGGGSVLSIPLLIFLGLPPMMANGTNRFGILWGNLASFWGLRRNGYWDGATFLRIIFPIMAGALLGSFFLVKITDHFYQLFLAGVIVLVALFTLLSSRSSQKKVLSESGQKWAVPVFFAVGIYGGTVQIGMGFVMIWAFTRFSGLDLIRVNALKGASAFVFLAASLFIFIPAGKVIWPVAIVLALGCLIGGWIGSKWQIRKGEKWVRRFLVILSLALALKLVWDILTQN